MPPSNHAARSLQKRSAYTRTAGNMLVNDSNRQPWTYWLGYDSGAGRYPIGPNGPYSVEVIPAVTRLTAIITDALSAVPYKVIRDSTGETLPTPRWLIDPQLLRPDERYPSQVLPSVLRNPRTVVWGEYARGAVWHGTGFFICLDDDAGTPIAGTVRVLHPQFVTPVRDEEGTLVWEIASDSGTPVRSDREGYLTIGPLRWRIIPLRDPHAPIDAEGHSVGLFERHQDVFGTTAAISGYTKGTFTSGVPSGVISVNTPGFTQEQATALKGAWMEAHGGDRRSVAVLNATTEFKPLSFSPVDAALGETKRANMADMALAFALDPAGALGISMGNSATYANVQQYYSRLKADLLPWIEVYEQVLSSLLPQGQSVRLDFSELTRPDPTEQYASLAGAIQSGLMTQDEARAVIGLPPAPAPPPPPPQLEQPEPDPTEQDPDDPEQRGALPWQLRRNP
jgi:hypothetical protein